MGNFDVIHNQGLTIGVVMNDTTQPKTAAVNSLPEFADHRTARALFGLSRSYLYNLAGERKIRSVSIRKPGALKGRRLFDCASIRAFLDSVSDQQTNA